MQHMYMNSNELNQCVCTLQNIILISPLIPTYYIILYTNYLYCTGCQKSMFQFYDVKTKRNRKKFKISSCRGLAAVHFSFFFVFIFLSRNKSYHQSFLFHEHNIHIDLIFQNGFREKENIYFFLFKNYIQIDNKQFHKIFAISSIKSWNL